LWYAVALYEDRTAARAMQVFAYSISYVTLLFSAIAVDQLVRHL
jgi:heme O synthase-like polyprenyltransferase